ncbi:uncharacterized protein EV154DRAFT_498608 [Mucor mucedo]|uniref:uncharacterized protein n=1 Tax=Mucor mucedo TaxID=29922 RepID=UPI00221F27D2|nr:uncharacterized protein EV154DRAFT_498608 [Mucor mucedo]KAI7894401.1 hypothetical protein EV154DRAFT_498608 [Mucor mucedo]
MRRPKLLSSILCITSLYAASAVNVVLWERSLTMNATNMNATNVGIIDLSTSYLATCQDFQGIQVDSSKTLLNRVVFNFGDCCNSTTTTLEYVQTLNNNSLQVAGIDLAQKIALIKRGNCKWSDKLDNVKKLSDAHSLHVTAMLIYDNETHNTNISVERTFVYNNGAIDPPEYSTPLPDVRNVVNMSDNDLFSSTSLLTPVYFVPLVYGELFIQRLKDSFDPTNPSLKKYWVLSPFLVDTSGSSRGLAGSDRAYIAYIIALGGIFVMGVIFLRWWKIRRLRAGHAFDGFTTPNAFGMQTRVNRLDPLPVEVVNSIPIAKYADDLVKNVNCAICLEDFVPDKNDIRILPCAHGFCVLCIDPWLTQKSCMCPICKWDCLPADLRRERNETLQRDRNARQSNTTTNESSTEINEHTVEIPIPSSVDAPESNPAENATTLPTTTITTTRPATTSPTTTNNTESTAEKDRPELRNPFASNSSSVNHQTGDSLRPESSTSPSEELEMTSKKRTSPKN